MKFHSTSFPSKALAAVVMAIALAVGALTAPAPARADSTCPDFNVCFWTAQHYTGGKQVYGNASEGVWRWVDGTGQHYNSLKNKFSNRAVLTGIPNVSLYCTNAGGINPTAGAFNVFYIMPAGSTC